LNVFEKDCKMKKRLKEKVAIVTGASRGIGKAISLALAKEAATVILAARAIDKLKETAEQVTAAGGKAHIIPTELTDEQSIKNLVGATAERFGRLDILVNNAGITHSAKLEETLTEDWDRCQQINTRAPFILCREALPLLKKAESAYIINIANQHRLGRRCQGLSASKRIYRFQARASRNDDIIS
jgi:NAD(P)-dependent dehydrogenase (short-subunit alcohol dehydrogenase family)